MSAITRSRLAVDSYTFQKDGYPVPGRDAQGFDTATGRIGFRGTIDQLYAKFPVGGTTGAAALPDAPSGSTFYCLGPVGRPVRTWGGHYLAEIQWKGIISDRNLANQSAGLIVLSAGQYLQSISQQMSTTETTWPQTRDGAIIYAGAPYTPAPGYREKGFLVMGAGGTMSVVTEFVPHRCRLISPAYTASARGIFIGSRSVMIQRPKCMLPNPFLTDPAEDIDARADLPDPLYSYSADTGASDGWVCRNYQHDAGGEFPVGDKILSFWTATYEFIRRKGI